MSRRRSNLVRLPFSALAAAVFLITAQEWLSWGIRERNLLKVGVGVGLTFLALFEAEVVWERANAALDEL